MKRFIRHLLCKVPYIKKLCEQVRKQGVYPAGHYHSPIPSEDEVQAYIESRKLPPTELPGINLNKQSQFELLREYVQFYKDLPFKEVQGNDHRYYYENIWFSYSDAIFLFCFLRKHQPKRIIEIGSGFSSAVMLDTFDGFFPQKPELTCIEPNPERLNSLLRDSDKENIRIIDKKIQEVPLEILFTLEKGDFLFIDSSHVVKCGNDLHLLMFEILPILSSGVFVHFHDIFYPFDYPSEWLKEGRYWNENYILRAFLSHNRDWSIYFFNSYVHFLFSDFIKEKMPLCMRNPGGSLYIQRVQIT
jgi:predicted O-methyltransferase YrrM